MGSGRRRCFTTHYSLFLWGKIVEKCRNAFLALGRNAQTRDQCGVFRIDALGVFARGASAAQRQLLGFALRDGAALGEQAQHALDRFIGTWSAEQESELLEAIEVFEQVDESFWQ